MKTLSLVLLFPVLPGSNTFSLNPDKKSLTTQNEIVILHTNDLHSHITGSAPESEYSPLSPHDDQTTGGFARLAGIIAREKQQDPELLVLDAGDFLMGTFFHALEQDYGFQLPLMHQIGYDAACLGNHEFDFGTGTLAEIISLSAQNGRLPQLLLGNIKFNSGDPADDKLEQLYKQSVIKRYHLIERKGLRIGLFGIIGNDAASVAPFIRPAEFTDPVDAARRISRRLKREEGADLVICLSHSGVGKERDGQWEGEDIKIARKAKNVDIIISGHTHTRLDVPIVVNGIPIVQTGAYGKFLGRLAFLYEQGSVKIQSYDLIPVGDDVIGDKHIHLLVESHKKHIDEEVLNRIGLTYDEPVSETGFDLVCNEHERVEESNLGVFLADALLYYVRSRTGNSADVAVIAAGMIRDGMAAGRQTVPDLFRIVSLGISLDSLPGYPLAEVYLTGRELKHVIEILLAVYHSSPSNYCYYSGLRATYDPDKGLLRKVRKIELGDEQNGYHEIDLSGKDGQLYGIVANAYMLHFIGMIRKKSFGLVNVSPRNRQGQPVTDFLTSIIDFSDSQPGIQEGKEWLALYYYSRSFTDMNGNGVPDVPEYYRICPQRLIRLEE